MDERIYDIKDIVNDFPFGLKVRLSARKGAYLTAQLLKSIKTNFLNKTKKLRTKVSQKVEEIKGSEEYQQAVEKSEEKAFEKAVVVEEKLNTVKQAEDYGDKEYAIKYLEYKMDRQLNRAAKVASRPRPLLISKLFLQKAMKNAKRMVSAKYAAIKEQKEQKKEAKLEASRLKEIADLLQRQQEAQKAAQAYGEQANALLGEAGLQMNEFLDMFQKETTPVEKEPVAQPIVQQSQPINPVSVITQDGTEIPMSAPEDIKKNPIEEPQEIGKFL